MKVLISHLTRMSRGYFCVAGTDVDTHEQVRPVLRGRLPNHLREELGGPFAVGNVVDLGTVVPQPSPPETEDVLFDASIARSLGRLPASEFTQTLSATAEPSISAVFGPAMKQEGPAAFFEEGEGKRSLAHLSEGVLKEIYQGPKGLRAKLNDGTWDLNLSVTDARLFSLDNEVDESRLAVLEIIVTAGSPVQLSVGVARPWPENQYRQFLQVNGVFPTDDPYWERFG